MEIASMHDRGAAIFAATLVEDALEDLLVSNMAKLSSAEHDGLFFGDAPLGRFSAKIRVSRAFKLIDKDSARDLNLIRDIRNTFAHASVSVSFETKEIANHIGKIGVLDMYSSPLFDSMEILPVDRIRAAASGTPKQRYVCSCMLLFTNFWYFPRDPEFDDDE